MALAKVHCQLSRPLRPVAALALVTLAGAGCGPQPLDIKTPFAFTQDLARASLKAQMAPALLDSVGGALPDVWPATAPRLLVDLVVLARARIDLAASGVDQSKWAAVRVRGVLARTTGAKGLVRPQPSELLLFAGPAGADSLSSAGVRRIARGEFPLVPPAIDCTPLLPCPPVTGDGGSSPIAQTLPLEPAGRGALQDFVLGSGQFELLLGLRIPIDSAADSGAPRGEADVELELDLELAP